MRELKLGRLTLAVADRPPKRPTEDEIGGTGTSIYSGFISDEEYNADLRGSLGMAVYDKMRRSDGQVKATLLACTLPIHAATWAVEAASDSPADVDIAREVEWNLFEGMTITWQSYLAHVLLMLPFGFSMFEKVWQVVDGKLYWRKLAPRLPKTLYKWDTDEHGGLRGVVQQAWVGDKYVEVTIPVEKLLVFTNEKEGSNFEGVSILRAAYKHWYFKDLLYRIDGIAAERHAVGLPVFHYPATTDDKAKAKLDEMGQTLQAHERMYLRLPDEVKFEMTGHTGAIRDVMPSIEHHDRMISRSVLAQFLNLGSGDVGSWALARDQSSFFLMALRAVTTNICDTMNRYAIPQWVDFNYGHVDAYPRLAVSGLETRDTEKYAKAVMDLVSAGVLTPGRDLEDSLRGFLKLPPLPEEAAQSEKRHVWRGAEYRRELTNAEKVVALDEVSSALDKAQEAFVKDAKPIADKVIDNLIDAVKPIIEKRQFDKVEGIEVRYRSQLGALLQSMFNDLYAYGRKTVKAEMKAQGAVARNADPITPGQPPLLDALMSARTRAATASYANKLRTYLSFEALRMMTKGLFDEKELRDGLAAVSENALKEAAGYGGSESFNFGRSDEAQAFADDIDQVQYSAILDGNVCEECAPLDGREWEYSDPRTEKYAGGNPDCLGRGRCRCLLVYIHKGETPARV